MPGTHPDLGAEWPLRLTNLIESLPAANKVEITMDRQATDVDGMARFAVHGRRYCLAVETLSVGQPRHVSLAALRLHRRLAHPAWRQEPTRGMVVAPYLSPQVRDLLQDENLDWMDLAGNARILFPDLYIKVTEANRNPFATKREQRSLFFPKSARVLKRLLLQPQRWWLGKELATQARVSEAQVSKVRQALADREWVSSHADRWRLSEPARLLDEWRDGGLRPPLLVGRFYTLLHGADLQQALRQTLKEIQDARAEVRLAGHSVARRRAPYARIAGEFLYADDVAQRLLKRNLKLVPTDQGENITLYRVDDEGLWQSAMPLAEGMLGTDPVQTYLDLLATGERGREAAEHWRREVLEGIGLEGA